VRSGARRYPRSDLGAELREAHPQHHSDIAAPDHDRLHVSYLLAWRSTVGTDADFDLLPVDEAPGPAADVGTALIVVGTLGIIVRTPGIVSGTP
jgi:hypothetical protein